MVETLQQHDHNGIVNGSHSLINNFKVNLNGRKVYDLNNANHCVNIKNLLEYGPSYAGSTATNEFFYLDTSRHAEEREFAAHVGGAAARNATIIRVSLREKLFLVHQPQSVLKYLLIDTVFSKHYVMNSYRIHVWN